VIKPAAAAAPYSPATPRMLPGQIAAQQRSPPVRESRTAQRYRAVAPVPMHAGAGTMWVGTRDRGMLLAAERGAPGPLEG